MVCLDRQVPSRFVSSFSSYHNKQKRLAGTSFVRVQATSTPKTKRKLRKSGSCAQAHIFTPPPEAESICSSLTSTCPCWNKGYCCRRLIRRFGVAFWSTLPESGALARFLREEWNSTNLGLKEYHPGQIYLPQYLHYVCTRVWIMTVQTEQDFVLDYIELTDPEHLSRLAESMEGVVEHEPPPFAQEIPLVFPLRFKLLDREHALRKMYDFFGYSARERAIAAVAPVNTAWLYNLMCWSLTQFYGLEDRLPFKSRPYLCFQQVMLFVVKEHTDGTEIHDFLCHLTNAPNCENRVRAALRFTLTELAPKYPPPSSFDTW